MRFLNLFALSTIGALTVLTMLPSLSLAGLKNNKESTDLSYKFYNQRIQLAEKPNQVAIVFKTENRTRTLGEPADHIKLQNVLRGGDGTRTLTKSEDLNVEVKPLGLRYAVLTLPATRSLNFKQTLEKRLEQSYVQSTLPIFQRQNAAAESNETIILHDEVVMGFEPGTSQAKIAEILRRYDAEIVRPLRFSRDRYLVRSRSASGAAILPLVEQLSNVTGVQSASPNLIQSVVHQPEQKSIPLDASPQEPAIDLKTLVTPDAKSAEQPYPQSLLPYQWHLNSRKRKVLGPRTDVRAPEAWAQGKTGKGSVVAVIDSAIQWDHPDLQGNLYEVPQNLPDLMPGERHGWDFSQWETTQTCKTGSNNCASGDPDTRLSRAELAELQPIFQRMFQSDAELLKQYDSILQSLRRRNPKLSNSAIANIIRRYFLSEIAGQFHGTWVAGVVAAKPQDAPGAIGVAPDAKILPVRVFGLGGRISTDGLIEAIGYAAARKADVINLSLGYLVPTQDVASQMFAVLDANPNLVVVASSGNENLDGSGYPAAIPGVLSVGASNLDGNRSPYSNYGRRLDVIAPGGDTSVRQSGGILTTGGTFLDGFWQGLERPKYAWGPAFDPLGRYVQVQGTSFSSPVVAGVVALMREADPQRKLNRTQIIDIVRGSADYQPLQVTRRDQNHYRVQKGVPSTSILNFGIPVSNPGIEKPGEVLPIEQYYFGAGLVNAAAAVEKVQKQVAEKTADR
jgi:serine protease